MIIPKERNRWSVLILDFVEEVSIEIIIFLMQCTFVIRVVVVTGPSMEPNYLEGDRLLILNNWGQVEQGDVVVILNVLPEPIIKRVIARENQTVDFDPVARAVLIDGVPLSDRCFGVEEGNTYLPYSILELMEFPQTVPKGCVFVLGDNRPVSEDSRFVDVGMIDKRHILGKAVFRIFPSERIGPAR